MKLFCLSVLIIITSCSLQNNIFNQKNYDYDDFIHLHIEWKDLFEIAEDQYLVYIYSHGCGYCQSIKNEIFNYVLKSSSYPLYFVIASSEINRHKNIDLTIGAESVDEVFIVGVPSILFIKNNVLTSQYVGVKQIVNLLNN
jgi:thioredoxin-related protein